MHRAASSASAVFGIAIALTACSMDLGALQRGDAGLVNPATDPGMTTAGTAAGAGSTAGAPAAGSGAGGAGGTGGASAAGRAGGASGASGAGRAGGAPPPAGSGSSAPAAGSGGMAPISQPSSPAKPSRTCGVPGLACCAPGNTCDIGACLRGKCTPYGGFYARTDACTVEPCGSRNAYTAGCSCPMGFDDTLLYEHAMTCGDGSAATAVVRSCTSGRIPEIAFAGVWVEGPDDRCDVGCRTPNPITGGCNCPSGAEQVSLNVDTAESGCPNASMTLQLCVDPDGDAINFGGAYAVSQTAALGCSAPNPLTAACSCPDGVPKPQSLHVGNWSIFVCNL